jgi:hypothetical protein
LQNLGQRVRIYPVERRQFLLQIIEPTSMKLIDPSGI